VIFSHWQLTKFRESQVCQYAEMLVVVPFAFAFIVPSPLAPIS
jgi:hypothetical protein